MFIKRDPEPKQPRLQGEDFDIFPTLDDEDLKRPAREEEDAPAAEPVEPVDDTPPEPTDFEKKIADIPDDKWKKYQIIAGVAMGILSSASIMVLGRMESIGSMGLILAAVLALFLPNMLEKKGGRRIPVLRTTLIIALVISMGLFAFYGFVLNPGYFVPTATPAATAAPTASATPAP